MPRQSPAGSGRSSSYRYVVQAANIRNAGEFGNVVDAGYAGNTGLL